MRHIFISPHLDDAVLSAGDLIVKLLKSGEKIRIITVFTDFGKGPMHWSARRYVFDSGALTASGFKRLRLLEDKRAMEKLGVNDYHYLNFTDAYFRLRLNRIKFRKLQNAAAWLGLKSCFLYPDSAALFSGKIDKQDKRLVTEICDRLKRLTAPPDKVYGPLGVGGHVDHIIVNQAVKKLKAAGKYFWLDLPYAVKGEFNRDLKKSKRGYRLSFSPPMTLIKYRSLKEHQSQSACRETIGLKPAEEIYESLNRTS